MNTFDDDSIDTRTFTSSTLALLRSSQSVDKTLVRTFKARLKTRNHDASGLNESLGDISAEASQLFGSASSPSLPSLYERSQASLEPLTSEQEFKTHAWSVFQQYSYYVGKRNFDGTSYSMPVENLIDAVEHLVPGRILTKNLEGLIRLLTSEHSTMLSWKEFKTIVYGLHPADEFKSTVEGSYSEFDSTLSISKEKGPAYTNLLHKQRVASTINLDDIEQARFRIPAVSETTTNLRAKPVPVGYVKDAMVDVFRREDSVSRNSPTRTIQTQQSIETFDDSTYTNLQRPDQFVYSGATIKYKRDEYPPARFENELHKSKIADLSKQDAEYYEKWLKMKKQRDERYGREYKRRVRGDVMHSFRRLISISDRNETAALDKPGQEAARVQQLHHDNQIRRNKLQHNIKRRKDIELTKKRNFAKQSRTVTGDDLLLTDSLDALRQASASGSRILENDDVLSMHDSLSSGFDSTSKSVLSVPSTTVKIPTELTERVKSATRFVYSVY